MSMPGEPGRLRRLALVSVALLFVAGVALVATSLLGSPEPVDWYQVAYDVGLGALIATGIGTLVSMFLSRIEAQEAAYLTEQRELAARSLAERRELDDRARREWEAHWKSIIDDLDTLNRDMDQTLLTFKIDEESLKIRDLITDTVEPVLTQIYELRTNVDPKFEHPHKPLVDAIMRELRAKVEAERLAAEKAAPDEPTSSPDPPTD